MATVLITFDVDAEAALHGMGIDPSTRPSLASHQRYGPEVGVTRILEVLVERGVRATFFVPGRTAELHPRAVEAILHADHEVAHHGYDHRPPFAITASEEEDEFVRGLEALARFGVRPTGYRAPWWEHSARTADLLIRHGFRYDSSLFDRDGPYLLDPDAGLVELPVSWALDDWERYAFWPDVTGSGVIARPSEVMESWWEEIDATTRVGGVAILTMHPFLSGRPARAAALGALMDRVAARGDIEMPTCGQVAERYASHREGVTSPSSDR